MILAMRRVGNGPETFFNLFSLFKSDLWFAMFIALLVNIILGIGFRMLEKSHITGKPIAPLDVSCIFAIFSTFKRVILAYLSNANATNWKVQQLGTQIKIRF